MTLTTSDLADLAGVARTAAVEAAEMIRRSRPTTVAHKRHTGSVAAQVVTEVDHRSEAIILEHLEPTLARYGLGLLTEERSDDGSRHTADHFWCVDPLDGTLPFVEGVAGSAVSIALVEQRGRPVIGVVVDLAEGDVWSAIAGDGVERVGSGPAGEPDGVDALAVFVDRSFTASPDRGTALAGLDRVAAQLGLSKVELHVGAGAVINALGVLDHRPACYVKWPKPSGGGHLWDVAATACIVSEAGAVATDIHGAPLDLNRPDADTMNHRGVLFASDAELAARVRRLPHPWSDA